MERHFVISAARGRLTAASPRAASFSILSVIVGLMFGAQALAQTMPSPQPGTNPTLVSPYEVLASSFEAPEAKPVAREHLGAGASNEIKELATGLKNDPDLIYQYVHDHVAYTPVYGYLKGPTATLLDGRGNDFDQASLMVALLREVGLTAHFIFGIIRLSPDQVTNWLGTPNDPAVIYRLLAVAGIPAVVEAPGGTLSYVDMLHVWVKVNLGGTDYVFDPSFKTHSYTPGINLASAMGYDRNAFLTSALSGATVAGHYVQNVNRANIRSALAGYATNLIDTIKSDYPAASVEDILGGRSIVPAAGTLRQTSLPYQQPTTAEWTEIPAQYQTTLRIQHQGIDETLSACDIYGKRLTVFFNASNQPVLRLDGGTIATGSAAAPDQRLALTLSVDHPYSTLNGTYADQSMTMYVKAGGSYLIVNGWNETGRGLFEKHRSAVKEARQAGLADTSEPVLGETLAMFGDMWLAEAGRADEISDRVAGTFTVHHHRLGLCGQMDSPYMDIPMKFAMVVSGTGDTQQEKAGFYSGAGHQSAFEWGVFDQMQPYSAVSTVKLIDLANSQADKIFSATSANYAATVKPQLINYNGAELALVESYLNAGYRVILPEDGNLNEKEWTGIGFVAVSAAEDLIFHMIGGGFSGGVGNEEIPVNVLAAAGAGDDGVNSGDHAQSYEPIDLQTGDYLHEHTDLTLGGSVFPFGLGFRRSYNSVTRFEDGPLGLGWTHSFQITALPESDGFQGLGADSPIDAAAAMVEQVVANDLLYGDKTVERLVVASVAHRWFMDQLIDNVVTVSEPEATSKYVKLPDESYHPPPHLAGTLVRNPDQTWQATTKHGIVLVFDAHGKISAWKDPNNNTVDFTYSSGRLQSVQNGMNRVLSFTYSGDRISTVADGTGRKVTYSYDVVGNLISVKDPLNRTTTFQYDAEGRLAKVFHPAHPKAPVVTNSYDSLGRVAMQSDAKGNTYFYYFSPYRAEEVDPLAKSRVLHFNRHGRTTRTVDPLGHVTTYAYDGRNRLTRTTLPEGNAVEYGFDANHNITKETLLPKPGASESPIITQYTYEAPFNRVKTVTDPLGRITTFTYDGKGNPVRIDLPQVDGKAPKFTMTYDGRGRLKTLTDPEGMKTGRTYDAKTADLRSVTVDQGRLGLRSRFAYDAVGNLTRLTDPLNHTTKFKYNKTRRLTQSTAPSPFGFITKCGCDANGKLTSLARQTGIPAKPWQKSSLTYSLTGNIESRTDPEGHTTAYQYDQKDRLWKVIDAEKQTKKYLYDALDRPFQVVDALGNAAVTRTYTPNGLTETLTDARGNITTYTYDGFDRPSKVTYPDGSWETFAFDDASNLITRRTRSGSLITFGYDELNRLKSRTLPGPISYQYVHDLVGRVTDLTGPGGTTHHDFDTAGRMVGETRPDGKTVTYKYDRAGNRIRLTYPDGFFVTYTYDALNRLTGVYEQGSAPLAQYQYDSLSRRTRLTYPNGTFTTYSYEMDDDLSAVQHQFSGGSASFSYRYNKIGNRTGFTVDDDRYLFQAPVSIDDSYVANSLNQYTAVKGVAFSYDPNGNLMWDGVRSFGFDVENRLLSCSAPGHAAAYVYDPLGRRTSKTADGATTKYVHDGLRVIAEYDSTDNLLRRYVYSDLIDDPICMKKGSASYSYHFDGSGSVAALSDASGKVAEHYAYSPYGIANEASGVGNPYLFTGRAFDAETGLYYFRSRYYAPGLGRFLQVDPIGYLGGLNLYGYVENNPLNWLDPFGWCKDRKEEGFREADNYWKALQQLEKDLPPGPEVEIVGGSPTRWREPTAEELQQMRRHWDERRRLSNWLFQLHRKIYPNIHEILQDRPISAESRARMEEARRYWEKTLQLEGAQFRAKAGLDLPSEPPFFRARIRWYLDRGIIPPIPEPMPPLRRTDALEMSSVAGGARM